MSPSQVKLTPPYLELMRYKSLATNTKLYFGPSIPSLFLRDQEVVAIPVEDTGSKDTGSMKEG